jgi:hypothetical protein
LNYFGWYPLQIFVSPNQNILELLQQFNQLNIDDKFKIDNDFHMLQVFVATLALGLRLKQGLVKVQAKSEARDCGKV